MDYESIAATVMTKLEVHKYIVMNAGHAHIQATDSAGYAEVNYAPNRKSAAYLLVNQYLISRPSGYNGNRSIR